LNIKWRKNGGEGRERGGNERELKENLRGK